MILPDLPGGAPGGDGAPASSDEAGMPRKPPLIPSHIAWPGFVVALLLLGIVSAFQAFFAARSDGGAQVVEDYYDAAVGFDEARAAQRASDALGWTAAVEVGACEGGLCPVEMTVLDRDGVPIEGLAGTVRASRPHTAQVLRLPLVETEAPGVYRQPMPLEAAGLWDVAVDARRGDERFLATVRLSR